MSAGGGRKKPRGCVRKCIDASTERLQSSPVSPTLLEKKIHIHATRRVLLGRCIDFDPILILRIPMELLWFLSDGWRVSQQKGESVEEEAGEYRVHLYVPLRSVLVRPFCARSALLNDASGRLSLNVLLMRGFFFRRM